MPKADFYDGQYGRLTADPHLEVRRETYGDDLGQASWITLAEAHEWFRLLDLRPGKRALEVGCGSGGVTCRMAMETGAACVGVDLNDLGIDAAEKRASEQGLSSDVSFQVADAGRSLPFPDASFDAIFCNDSINHFPGRAHVLRDWHRVLRPGGRLLFTDPIVVTGQLTNEEIRARSSIGFFLFTPVGENERLLTRSVSSTTRSGTSRTRSPRCRGGGSTPARRDATRSSRWKAIRASRASSSSSTSFTRSRANAACRDSRTGLRSVEIRPATRADSPAWERMRHALWPSEAGEHAREIARYFDLGGTPQLHEVLLACDEKGETVGMKAVLAMLTGCGCATLADCGRVLNAARSERPRPMPPAAKRRSPVRRRNRRPPANSK